MWGVWECWACCLCCAFMIGTTSSTCKTLMPMMTKPVCVLSSVLCTVPTLPASQRALALWIVVAIANTVRTKTYSCKTSIRASDIQPYCNERCTDACWKPPKRGSWNLKGYLSVTRAAFERTYPARAMPHVHLILHIPPPISFMREECFVRPSISTIIYALSRTDRSRNIVPFPSPTPPYRKRQSTLHKRSAVHSPNPPRGEKGETDVPKQKKTQSKNNTRRILR